MTDKPTQEQIEKIGSALASGRKVEAIKVYREATGKSLKDAKEFIDALIPRLKEQNPEKYAKLSAKGTGCASVILMCAGLATGGIGWIIKFLT